MPEASVHKHGPLSAQVRDVWRPREIAIAHSIAQPEHRERPPYRELRLDILLSYIGHPTRRRRVGHDPFATMLHSQAGTSSLDTA